MHIFADGFSRISLANNNLRIALTQNGPDNQPMDAGTLIIPANMATGFVNSLTSGLKQLEEQVKAKAQESQEKKSETLQ
jgi:hypothetical protein